MGEYSIPVADALKMCVVITSRRGIGDFWLQLLQETKRVSADLRTREYEPRRMLKSVQHFVRSQLSSIWMDIAILTVHELRPPAAARYDEIALLLTSMPALFVSTTMSDLKVATVLPTAVRSDIESVWSPWLKHQWVKSMRLAMRKEQQRRNVFPYFPFARSLRCVHVTSVA